MFGRYLPSKIVAGAPEGAAAASGIPLLAERRAIDGKPTAYLCRRYVCQLPVTAPADLARQLEAELACVGQQIEQGLAHLGEVGVHVEPRLGLTVHPHSIAILVGERPDDRDDLGDEGGHTERLESRGPCVPASILERSRTPLIELEKVLACRIDLPEVGDERLLAEIAGLLLEHLGVADDRVERRPQLV